MKIVFAKVYDAYLLFPELGILPSWNSSGMVSFVPGHLKADMSFSMIILIAITLILIRKPLALLLFWAGTIGFLGLYGLTFTLGARHIGHLFILFITALWLADYFPHHHFKYLLLRRFSKWGKKIQHGFIVLVFSSQMIVGIAYFTTDLNMPFSASKEAAKFIRERQLQNLPIVGAPGWAASDFAALLDRPIYYPEKKDLGTFVIWKPGTTKSADFGELGEAIDTVLGKDHPQALVLLNSPIEKIKGEQPPNSETISPNLRLHLLASFKRAMMSDEVYYIYLAQRMKS